MQSGGAKGVLRNAGYGGSEAAHSRVLSRALKIDFRYVFKNRFKVAVGQIRKETQGLS